MMKMFVPNNYKAAGPISRNVPDSELPSYVSKGYVTISGEEPNMIWVQSSYNPLSTTIYRLLNFQMSGSTIIMSSTEALVITAGFGYPIHLNENVPMSGFFTLAGQTTMYSVTDHWTVEAMGGELVFTFFPASIGVAEGYVEFYLNFNLLTLIKG